MRLVQENFQQFGSVRRTSEKRTRYVADRIIVTGFLNALPTFHIFQFFQHGLERNIAGNKLDNFLPLHSN